MAPTTTQSSTVTREPQADGSTKVTTTTVKTTLDRQDASIGVSPAGDYNQTLTEAKTVDVETEGAVTPPPANKPPVLSVNVNPTSGQAPLAVAFAATATDPEGKVVTYKWTFGDGTTSTAASLSKTVAAAGDFAYSVVATDDKGATATQSGKVTVTAAPPVTTHDTMFFTGPNLFRADGTRIIPKGIEQYFTQPSNPVPKPMETLPEMIRCRPSAIRILPNPPGSPIQDIVDGCKFLVDNKLMIDMGLNGGTDAGAYATYRSQLAPFEKNMIIHHGESYANNGADWVAACNAFRQTVRAAGWKCPIQHMANNGGRNWATVKQYAQQVYDADPLHNTGFGVQLYWSGSTYTDLDQTGGFYQNLSGCTLRQAVDQIDAFPLYVQVGLCSDQPDMPNTKVPWRGLIDYIEASHPEVPWFWWAWNSGGPGTMTMSWIYAGPLSWDAQLPPHTQGVWNFDPTGTNDAGYVAEKCGKSRKA